MSFDELNAGDRPERRPQPADAPRPLTDREVPVGGPSLTLADSLHAWLDGEGSESHARRDQTGRDVDFWKRLRGDLATRRRTRSPAGLDLRIMAAIRTL